MKLMAIIIFTFCIILFYIILFYVLKKFSIVIIEYDNEDSKGKREILLAFVLYSCFIIGPSYLIFSCFCKLLEFFYS